MSGYISPGGNTALSVDGGTTYDKGNIELNAGPGISWARTPGPPVIFTATGSVADASQPPSLFIAGALAAADPVAVFAQLSQSGRSYLTGLELNLGTAPVGSTVSNNNAVKVYSSAGSQSLTLPIDGTGDNAGKHYALDAEVGSQAGAQTNINPSDSVSAMGNARICAFQVTAATVVGGIGFAMPTTTAPGRDGSGFAKIAEIYNAATFALLAQSGRYYGPTSVSGATTPTYPISFLQSVTLQPGVNYLAVLRCPDDAFFRNTGSPFNITGFSVPPANTAATYTGILTSGTLIGGAMSWGIQDTTAGVPQLTSLAAAVNPSALPLVFALYGGARSALIIGQIKVAIVVNGTGPTTPGQNLNIRMNWQSA